MVTKNGPKIAVLCQIKLSHALVNVNLVNYTTTLFKESITNNNAHYFFKRNIILYTNMGKDNKLIQQSTK